MPPDPLLQFGGIGLNPPENGGVIDRDATIMQHKFKIVVADRELEIPPHSPKDHLSSELSPLELLARMPHRRPRLVPNRTDPTRGAAALKPRNRTEQSPVRRAVNQKTLYVFKGKRPVVQGEEL
jgi:hypothetical protein